MKRPIVVLLSLTLMGCAYKGQTLETYIEEPDTILKDPHFASYQDQADSLEKDYLNKKITYADYVEQKKQLDEKYNKEVDHRESVMVPEKDL